MRPIHTDTRAHACHTTTGPDLHPKVLAKQGKEQMEGPSPAFLRSEIFKAASGNFGRRARKGRGGQGWGRAWPL